MTGRDLALRDLATEAVGAELDASTWRVVTLVAISQIADMTAANIKLREQIRHLREDFRDLRQSSSAQRAA